MAETVRTIDDFVNASTGLFKDNTAGDISAQDLRDFVWSSQGRNLDDAGTKTASYTATVGAHARVDMNGAGADFVVTFPGSPVVGDRFAYTLARAHATYNLTVARNGSTLYGSTANEALFTTREAGHTSFWRYESTSSGQGWVRENEPKVNVQEFTADGTWIKPPGALTVDVLLINGGNGGGSGRRGANGGARYGGGGGSHGNCLFLSSLASVFGATESVTVGAGGAGGAAVTADDTSGNNGTAGGQSAFGSLAPSTSNPGNGGTGASGTGGSNTGSTTVMFGAVVNASFGLAIGGANGGQGGGSSGANASAAAGQALPGSGGGGGGVSSGNLASAGGTGGYPASGYGSLSGGTAGANTGGAGGNGNDGSTYDAVVGTGGGGGGGNPSGAGGAGGNGGKYGAGGGGGGASANGNNSGAGGTGGAGYALIITFCK